MGGGASGEELVTLDTPRLMLRQWQATDLDRYVEMFADPAFRLAFAAGNQGFRPVGVQLTGCRSVTGLGPARSWSQSPQFGPLLTRTVGGVGRPVPGRHPSSVPTP